MLILTQNGNKLVNLDSCESVEIDYSVGNAYGIKAVIERNWNDPGYVDEPVYKSTIRLGVYNEPITAEAVMHSIFYAYERECKTYKMPPDGVGV